MGDQVLEAGILAENPAAQEEKLVGAPKFFWEHFSCYSRPVVHHENDKVSHVANSGGPYALVAARVAQSIIRVPNFFVFDQQREVVEQKLSLFLDTEVPTH